jgi:hypothetical protein
MCQTFLVRRAINNIKPLKMAVALWLKEIAEIIQNLWLAITPISLGALPLSV